MSSGLFLNAIFSRLWPFVLKYIINYSKEHIHSDMFEISFNLAEPNISKFETLAHDNRSITMRIKFGSNEPSSITYSPKSLGFLLNIMKGSLDIHSYHLDILVKAEPLLDEPPFIGALIITSPNPPSIKYDISKQDQVIQHLMHSLMKYSKSFDDIIKQLVVSPNFHTIFMTKLKPPVLSKVVSPLPFGVLKIVSVEMGSAEDLNKKFGGLSDMFAEISIGAQYMKTTVVDDTKTAKYEINKTFYVSSKFQNIVLRFWDENLSKRKNIGEAIFPVKVFENNTSFETNLRNRSESVTVEAILTIFGKNQIYDIESPVWKCLYFKIWFVSKSPVKDLTELQIKISTETTSYESKKTKFQPKQVAVLGVDALGNINNTLTISLVARRHEKLDKVKVIKMKCKDVLKRNNHISFSKNWVFKTETYWHGLTHK